MSQELPTILIVDDTPENLELMRQILRGGYKLKAALDGDTAIKLAATLPTPDLILLDVMMPGLDGYEVCTLLKQNPITAPIPVIFVTALDRSSDEMRGLDLGAVDYITKPLIPELLLARVRTHIELRRHQEHLESLVAQRTEELALTQQVTIEALATLAEHRDPDTGGHIKRTQNYVRLLAELASDHTDYSEHLDEEMIELCYRTAPLHDIGKVAVPDPILLKAGRLTEAEFNTMKLHVKYGADALQIASDQVHSSRFLQVARELILTHHEQWDGNGYPKGLKGEEIPLSGRLMALADVYDALISERVYKPAIPHDSAVAIITQGRGTHFDPRLVDLFTEHHQRFWEIAQHYTQHKGEEEV